MSAQAGYVDRETANAISEKKNLRKNFRRLDMYLFSVAAVIILDTIGQVASNGAQGFTWLVFLGVLFFIPYALIVAELGSAFPEEGGPYVWCRLAFGRLIGAIIAVIYWVSVPLWVGGSLVIVSMEAFSQNFTPITGGGRYVYGLAFIWFCVLASIVGFRIGKWIPNLGGLFRIGLLGFFFISVMLYGIKHGLHGVSGGDFMPSYVVFIAVVPVLAFNYTGLELANTAAEEMIDPQRDVPKSVARSTVTGLLGYGLPVLAILLVLPTEAVTGLSGFLNAARTVFSVYGGSVASDGTVNLTGFGVAAADVCAFLFIFGLLTSGSSWLMGGDRATAIASADGAGPRPLGVFSRVTGTPVRVNVLSGVMATATMFFAFWLAGDNPNKYFEAVLGLTISASLVSLLGIFPAIIKLRYSHAHVRRPFRIPGGNAGAWVCGILTTFWCALATLALVWPGFGIGWFGTSGNPDDALVYLSFGGQRLQYELTQLLPLLFFVGVGIVFYLVGGRTRRDMVDVRIAAESNSTESVASAEASAAAAP